MWPFSRKERVKKLVEAQVEETLSERNVNGMISKAVSDYFGQWTRQRYEDLEEWKARERQEKIFNHFASQAFDTEMKDFIADIPREFLDAVVEKINQLQLRNFS